MDEEEKKLLDQEGKDLTKGSEKPAEAASVEQVLQMLAKAQEMLYQGLFDTLLKGVRPPATQKIAGAVKIAEKIDAEIKNFPDIQKIKGDVNANVNFPEIQKIAGEVIAKVLFPHIQKVSGRVKADVDFPDVQKIKGEVEALVNFEVLTTKMESLFADLAKRIPLAVGPETSTDKANPQKYIPVRLTNGKFFYEMASQTIQSNGRVAAAVEKLVAQAGNNGSFITQNYDYVSVAYPDGTTETYTFKRNGASGTTVATVTVVYTDSTKENISSVTKS